MSPDVRVRPWLMSTDEKILTRLARPGAVRPDAIVVDWECHGKHDRQRRSMNLFGSETTMVIDDDDATRRARLSGIERLVIRLNPYGTQTRSEIERARRHGADDVLIPMIRSVEEIDVILDMAAAQRTVGVAMMFETAAAIRAASDFASRPLSFGFVGLVDLALDRRSPSIFEPLLDGVLESLVASVRPIPIGFGGLTLRECGHPIPNHLLVNEMLRLGAAFSVLRSSFLRDLGDTDPSDALEGICRTILTAQEQTPDEINKSHEALLHAIRRLCQ